MRRIVYVAGVIALFILVSSVQAQVTNLTVNGSSSPFSFMSGDPISWEFNLPTGDTSLCQIWLDVNQNGAIDPGTDHLYLSFTTRDGDPGSNGPPDIDGLVNGHIAFSGAVGLAPSHLIVRFTDHSVGLQVSGVVTPLTSVVHTVSGTVTVPAGKSPRYILMELSRNGGDPNFWHGLTDSVGHYAIQMNADTAGNPWRLQVNTNPYPPAVVFPRETTVVVSGNPSGYNFAIVGAAAQIAGIVRSETGTLLSDVDVNVGSNNGQYHHDTRTNPDGTFQIGLPANELPGQTWNLQTSTDSFVTTTILQAQKNVPTLASGDSAYRVLTVFSANAQISGQVRVNGSPAGFPVQLVAQSMDSAQASSFASGGTGNFSLGVTTRIWNYNVFTINMPPNVSGGSVSAHPGNTGVIINLTMTAVEGNETGTPQVYAISQNYPNPFNPTTMVSYQLPTASNIKLAVYDFLGREVAVLVEANKAPGVYLARWDATGMSSGVYFARLTAGSFVQTRKMTLVR
jgi:hypothetical protein